MKMHKFIGGMAIFLTLSSVGLSSKAAIDPFNTESLTVADPQTYWDQRQIDFKVTDTSAFRAASQLPHNPLTLAEIVDFALRNNPQTSLAWAQAKVAAAKVGSAEAAYLPQITAGAAVQFTANIFTSPDSSATTYGPNMSLSYLLLDFG